MHGILLSLRLDLAKKVVYNKGLSIFQGPMCFSKAADASQKTHHRSGTENCAPLLLERYIYLKNKIQYVKVQHIYFGA